MTPETTRKHPKFKINITDMIDFPDELKQQIGSVVGAEQGRRIRESNYNYKLQPLDPNTPSWENFKQEHGSTGQPLILTNELTEPTAWNVDITEDTIKLTLNQKHWEKWDNIVNIAEKTGRNWVDAFGVGKNEAEAIEDVIMIYFRHKYGIELRVNASVE